MVYIEQDKLNIDVLIVKDENDNPVTGLIISDFTIKLYNPNKEDVANISSGVIVNIDEVGDGIYRVQFTPDELGDWDLVVYNSTYFPFGKGENYSVVLNLGGLSPELEDIIRRTIGLTQENYRVTNQTYDKNNNLSGGLISIYPSALDLENNSNVMATYQMSAVFNLKTNHLTDYKVKRLS
jgi:hypothetical protein